MDADWGVVMFGVGEGEREEEEEGSRRVVISCRRDGPAGRRNQSR